MTEESTSKSSQHEATIVVDRTYIREQANEALKAFVAPLSGVYAAAFGPISTPAEPPPRKAKGAD